MTDVVVQLPEGEGIIRGESGEIELTDDVTHGRGQPLPPWNPYSTLRLGLGDGRMLFGGLLPPGAVSVEAVEASGIRKPAVVGGGAFAVIFEDREHGDPALGFRDPSGEFVHRPMPAEYPHRPVEDAEEPCPVCGAVAYEEYLPTEEWRASDGTDDEGASRPSPLIVCRVCGHQEVGGGIIRFHRPERDEEDPAGEARLARARAEQEAQRWHSDQAALKGVTFPVYAARGWPARINGRGSRGDEITNLRIAHAPTLPDLIASRPPQIQVAMSVESHRLGELATARKAFGSLLRADSNERPKDTLSDAAAKLWFRAAHRRQVTGAHQAPVGTIEISIDGTPEQWVLAGTPNARWVAVRNHHGVTITVLARDVDPATLRIETIADPAARLLGPQPEAP